jgi:5-methylcytosine-specific restriction endonuclease McrA
MSNYWQYSQKFVDYCEKRRLEATRKSKKRPVKAADFYSSREWRRLRYRALRELGNRCCLCGACPNTGAVLHVDHIQPRSKRPDLALELSNLQVLCEDCNLGKSNRDSFDYR